MSEYTGCAWCKGEFEHYAHCEGVALGLFPSVSAGSRLHHANDSEVRQAVREYVAALDAVCAWSDRDEASSRLRIATARLRSFCPPPPTGTP